MAESVPTFFWNIAVDPLSEPFRRCLLSVAAYRHTVLLRVPLAMQGCASDECKR